MQGRVYRLTHREDVVTTWVSAMVPLEGRRYNRRLTTFQEVDVVTIHSVSDLKVVLEA